MFYAYFLSINKICKGYVVIVFFASHVQIAFFNIT